MQPYTVRYKTVGPQTLQDTDVTRLYRISSYTKTTKQQQRSHHVCQHVNYLHTVTNQSYSPRQLPCRPYTSYKILSRVTLQYIYLVLGEFYQIFLLNHVAKVFQQQLAFELQLELQQLCQSTYPHSSSRDFESLDGFCKSTYCSNHFKSAYCSRILKSAY